MCINKQKILKLLIIITFIFISMLITNKVYAKNYTIEEMDINATIQNDGSVNVVQKITYYFDGEYNGIFIDIPHEFDDVEYDKIRNQDSLLPDSLYNNSGVQIISVSDDKEQSYTKVSRAVNGNRRVYTEDIEKGILRLKVFSPSVNTTKTFIINYILKDVCVKHLDVGELYYNFIGGSWKKDIKKLNIDIFLNNNTTRDNLLLFAHGPYNGRAKIVSESYMNLYVENVRKGQFVSARVIFDLSNIQNAKKESKIVAKNYILDQEDKIYNNIKQKQDFTRNIVIFALILLVYWLMLLFIFEKENKYDIHFTGEEELFDRYNPLLAGCIAGSREVMARDIIAVILNLIDKKIINLTLIPKPNGKDTYIYSISKNLKEEEEMDKIERYIYDWVFEGKESVDLDQRLKQIPKTQNANKKFKELNRLSKETLGNIGANKAKVPILLRAINTFIFVFSILLVIIQINYNGFETYNMTEVFTKSLVFLIYVGVYILPLVLLLGQFILQIFVSIRHKVTKLIYKITSQKVATTSIAVGVVFAVLIVLTKRFIGSDLLIAYELLLCISIIIVLTDNLMLKHDNVIVEDFSRLNALKDKIRDYSMMEDKDLEQIELWEKYLAYGVALGVATKALERIKNMYIDDDLINLMTSNMMGSYMRNDYEFFYLHASLDRRFIRQYSKVVNKALSSMGSGGSGGSSGGGGSFGGGGGFSGGGGRGGGRRSFLN